MSEKDQNSTQSEVQWQFPLIRVFYRSVGDWCSSTQVFNEKLVMSHMPTYAKHKHHNNDKVRCEQESFSLL